MNNPHKKNPLLLQTNKYHRQPSRIKITQTKNTFFRQKTSKN